MTYPHSDTDIWGLPDPETQAAFYDSVPTKRLVAFVLDMIAIVILSALIVPLTAFTGIFFFPFIVTVVSYAYRVVTLANGSATLGMRLMGIEFRTAKGEMFDLKYALMHTTLFTIWGVIFIAQVASVVMMLTTARKQGAVGPVAWNRGDQQALALLGPAPPTSRAPTSRAKTRNPVARCHPAHRATLRFGHAVAQVTRI